MNLKIERTLTHQGRAGETGCGGYLQPACALCGSRSVRAAAPERGKKRQMRIALKIDADSLSAATASVTGCTEPDCIPSGWVELVFEGLKCEGSLHAKLRTTSPSGADFEYLLPPASTGSFKTILFAEEPIASLELTAVHDAQTFELPSCRIIRLGPVGVLLRSLRTAFTATLVAAFWRALGKKLRARNRLRRILSLPAGINYAAWRTTQEPKWAQEIAQLNRADSNVPSLGVLIDVSVGTPIPQACLHSLRDQVGIGWQLVLLATEQCPTWIDSLDEAGIRFTVVSVDPSLPLGARLQKGLEAAATDWVFILRSGDELAQGALARLAHAAMHHPRAAALYGDHDLIDVTGRRH